MLAVFANTEVEWPESVRQVFKYMSLVNFNINVTPPECAFAVSYRVKWLVIEWFPTVMFGGVAVVYTLSFVFFRYCANQNTRKVRDFRNNLIAGSLLTMYLLYLNISELFQPRRQCRMDASCTASIWTRSSACSRNDPSHGIAGPMAATATTRPGAPSGLPNARTVTVAPGSRDAGSPATTAAGK